MCLVDMRASGESQGQFCTLGIKESLDIFHILNELKSLFKCRTVLLYGRSMGAASVMKFIVERKKGKGNSDKTLPRVEGVVLDSPYFTVKKFFFNFVRSRYFGFITFLFWIFNNPKNDNSTGLDHRKFVLEA